MESGLDVHANSDGVLVEARLDGSLLKRLDRFLHDPPDAT